MIVEGAVVRSRLLSPREAARLMGLSDDYVLPGNYNDAYASLATAWRFLWSAIWRRTFSNRFSFGARSPMASISSFFLLEHAAFWRNRGFPNQGRPD